VSDSHPGFFDRQMLYRSHKNVDDVKIPYEFLQSYNSDIGGGARRKKIYARHDSNRWTMCDSYPLTNVHFMHL